MDVADWLRGLGLQRYERAFHENDIGPELLPALTADDLRELGVLSLGHRKTLLGAISALAEAAAGAGFGTGFGTGFGAETGPPTRAHPAASGTHPGAPPGVPAGFSGAPEPPPAPPAPPGERRQLTVVFCDLVASTALAGRLDPEDYEGVIRRYQEVCAGVVARHDGRLFEFLGDGVLVHFGHPRAHEDDAERAVRAGLDLVEAVGALAAPDGVALCARVGIATGLVVVGAAAVGRDRGALGETPALAARLQAVAGPGAVAVDAATRRLVEGLFEFGEPGLVAAKGFAAPVEASRALRRKPVDTRSQALHSLARSAPLVGREQEVELLLHRWKQARRGEGHVVLLSGEAGIGKSRIAAGLMARLAQERHTALRYFCSPYHQDSALFPIARQIEHAAGFERGAPPATKLSKLDVLLSMATQDAEEIALIADLLAIPPASIPPSSDPASSRAVLRAAVPPPAARGRDDPSSHGGPVSRDGPSSRDGPLPGVAAPPDVAPHKRKEKLLGALLAQLAGLASRRPVLALIEDAHWIDPTSLELLELAVERIRRLPVLLVVTFRPEFRPPWIGMPHVTALALGGLSRAEAAALVEQTAGVGALSPATVAGIVERTDGVPLFMEELTRAVAEGAGHDIAPKGEPGEAARGATAGAPAPRAVPAALHAPLMARFDRLGPAKEVAQIGAAIGREFPYDLLAAVARLPAEALDAALDRLVEAGMVCRRGAVPWATFLFKHALVQDAAYGTLLRATRRELHARIARCIEAEFPEVVQAQPERLAQHCADADMVDEAVEYWSRAGRRAIARSGMREAAAHLRRAIALLARLPDTPARQRRELDLTTLLGTALIAVKGYTDEETRRAYARARALYEGLGDTSRLTSVIRGQCSVHIVRGEVPAVLSAAADLLAEAERQGSREMRLTAHQLLGIGVLYAGRLHEAREHLETAAGLLAEAGGGAGVGEAGGGGARFTNGMDALVGIPVYRALALALLGRYEAARTQNALSLSMARRHARPHRLAFALGMTVWFHTLLGEDASRHLAELATLSAEQGYPYWTGFVQVCQGLALCRAGDAERGVALAREGVAGHDAMGASWSVPIMCVTVAGAVEGREALALPLVDEAFARTGGTGVRFFDAEQHRVRGKLLLGLGDATGAEAHYTEALAIARAQDARHWEVRAATDLARLWRDRGRCAQAHDLLAPVHAWFADGAGTPGLRDAAALLAGLEA